MLNDKVIITAFVISLAGHGLLLGSKGFYLPLPQQKKIPEEVVIHIVREEPVLLPKIEVMGQENKFKSVEKPPQEAKPEVKQELKPEVKREVKPEAIPDVRPEVKPGEMAEVKPEVTPEVSSKVTPEVNPNPLLEEIVVPEAPQERVEENVEVTNPDKEAMLLYQDMVKQKIEQTRRYPFWAKKQGIEGITHLNFSVLPNGIGQDIKIIHSSGSIILDEEAVATVKRASPFPPVPNEISRSFVSMDVAIVFSLNKK